MPHASERSYHYSDQLKTSLPDDRPLVATVWHTQGGGGVTEDVGAIELELTDGSILCVEGDVAPAPESNEGETAEVDVAAPYGTARANRMSCRILDELVEVLWNRATSVRYDPHGWGLDVTPWESPADD